MKAAQSRGFLDGIFRISKNIGNLNGFAPEHGSPDRSAARRRPLPRPVLDLPTLTAPIDSSARRTLRLSVFGRRSALGNAQSIASEMLIGPSKAINARLHWIWTLPLPSAGLGNLRDRLRRDAGFCRSVRTFRL